MKDPHHLAVRPSFHWTDQKLQVHTFCCVLAFLLVKLLELKARSKTGYRGTPTALLEQLSTIRQASVMETRQGSGRLRVTTQLEILDPETQILARALGLAG